MICLTLTGESIARNLELLEADRHLVDMVELRADFLEEWDVEEIRAFPQKAGLPVILTLRLAADGGRWSGSPEERNPHLADVLCSDFAWIDLEHGSDTAELAAQARSLGVGIIRSLHDFNGVPDNLAKLTTELPEADDEIPKLAVMPRSTADLRRIFTALSSTSGRRIILGMGSWGFPSRILAPYFGAWLTFVSAPGMSAAPGHLDAETLTRLYRYRTIGPATKVYGVIGNPVMHSRSPEIHNPAYSEQGVSAVYIPFQVDSLKEWAALCGELPVSGFSVTIPHKQKIIPLLDTVAPSVAAVGACNTVTNANGGWEGENTDSEGFLTPLRRIMGTTPLASRKITVIGAGGAARAAVWALRESGAELLIVNRTAVKAQRLADEFGCCWAPLSAESYAKIAEYSEIIVQTTPAGMHPNEEQNPLEGYPWRGIEIAYDMIYAPPETQFLQAAAAAGCRILNGEAMLTEQGKLQYRLFTGEVYPGQ